jgi:hypothetical protein
MAKPRYIATTKGSRTIVRRIGGSKGARLARPTTSPPWDEIKHLYGKPDASPKRERKSRRR